MFALNRLATLWRVDTAVRTDVFDWYWIYFFASAMLLLHVDKVTRWWRGLLVEGRCSSPLGAIRKP